MSVPVSADNMWFGYKFVGDNIDKNIKPRFQQQECQAGQSLHYDAVPAYIRPDPAVLFPSLDELSVLKDELMVLVSR